MSTAPLWLFTGPELGQRRDSIEQLRQKARKLFGQTDEYRFYANDSRIADIVSLLQNESLFASARFIVLHNSEDIKLKADIDMLADWAAQAAKQGEQGGAWLILDSDEISVDKKLENIVTKANRHIFWELFENQKTAWLQNWFSKEGFTIDSDACDAILDLVENNTETLKSECSRFLLCFDKSRLETKPHISVADVDAVLTRDRQESPFTLFAALCNTAKNAAQRLTDALSILQHIRRSKESSAVQLIAGLTYCFRKLRIYQRLAKNGSINDFELKTNGFTSKRLQSQYGQAGKLWNSTDTLACLALLSRTDMNIRRSGSGTEDTELQLMLYKLSIPTNT